MELNILEKSKTKLVFEMKGGDSTVCNPLKKELWNDSDVKFAGYNIEHPQIGIPRFHLETKSKEATKVLLAAISRVKKENGTFLKAFKKAC